MTNNLPEYVYIVRTGNGQDDDLRIPVTVEMWTDDRKPVIRRADGQLEELGDYEAVEAAPPDAVEVVAVAKVLPAISASVSTATDAKPKLD